MNSGRRVTAREAVASIEPGMRVRFPVGHYPEQVADQLAARALELTEVEVSHTAAVGDFAWLGAGFEDAIDVVHEHWVAPQSWPAMKARQHDYVPMPFSLRFKGAEDGRAATERRDVDVACIQVSPPDQAGMINLGRAIWDAPEWMRRASIVIAEIVPNTPIVCGDGSVPADLVTFFVEGPDATPLHFPEHSVGKEIEQMTGLVASLIEDGDTLEIGVGSATSSMSAGLVDALSERNDLGWHSESTGPALLKLIASGVMNSSRTAPHVGVAVSAGWAARDEDLDILVDNAHVQGREIRRVVDPRLLASIPSFKAINTGIMVDLTGQAAAETVGTHMHGGTGGLLELILGALWSPGGRSIMALRATDSTGTRSRIVPMLPVGTQATVPRTLADTVVTEYGIARLWGKTVRERAAELISVSAPQFRDELEHAARRLYYP
jgi:4-hydroxybutyrate CoA-transferase